MNRDGVPSHIWHLLWTVIHASIPSSSPGPEEAGGQYDGIQQKENKKKTKKEKKVIIPLRPLLLSEAHHHMTYCNWILQVGLVWEKMLALSIHTCNNIY